MGKAQGELPLWGKCKVSPGVPSGALLASHCVALCHKPTKAVYHFQPLERKAQVRRNGTGSSASVCCNYCSWAAISENVDVHSSSDEALWPNAVPENFLRWWTCSLICVVQYCGCWPHVALESLPRGLLWLRHWFLSNVFGFNEFKCKSSRVAGQCVNHAGQHRFERETHGNNFEEQCWHLKDEALLLVKCDFIKMVISSRVGLSFVVMYWVVLH